MSIQVFCTDTFHFIDPEYLSLSDNEADYLRKNRMIILTRPQVIKCIFLYRDYFYIMSLFNTYKRMYRFPQTHFAYVQNILDSFEQNYNMIINFVKKYKFGSSDEFIRNIDNILSKRDSKCF